MHTPWGYQVGELQPILTVAEFDQWTGGRYAGDLRAQAALEAATAAIRNECGWHIAPNLECTAALTARGRLCKLPAKLVTAVASVSEDGAELAAGQYEWRADGLMRRACFRNWTQSWGGVAVNYSAGFEPDAVPDLLGACCRIAEAVMAVPVGVSQETAGGVNVSYMATASSIASSMTDQMRASLAPYRLVSSHAA